MGQISLEVYLVKCSPFFFQSLDNQYSETIDSEGLNFLSHRVPPVDITFGILSDMQEPPTGGPPGGPGGNITYPGSPPWGVLACQVGSQM